ncbi:alginate lyase family protein [Haloarcula onubensis]|uniref:Heparinase II/III family protein n=1 Tax=Haloarcula onubensis TaxID=2950539 RepID=A0ABU2FMW2_9EURY|nr:alginate lyase family protein [Halomicroarcula sp. S3CR25-11]MDS0281587.1 heparinase II/III family protein [Halomicroarcula sp. S3CR25-11]
MSGGQSRLSQLTDTETAPLLYETVRNMETRQLLGVADRTLRQLVVPSLPLDADQWYDRKVPSGLAIRPGPVRGNTTTLRRCLGSETRERYRERADETATGTVTLLDRSLSVAGEDGVGWLDESVLEPPAMWALKFHGFEFLSWATLGYDEPTACPAVVETVEDWLTDWDGADATRVGAPGYLRRAWTPHAVSLRTINLVRLCAWVRRDTGVEALAARLVYRNAAFLANHVEHDVGGNHLIENGAALVMAGTLFDGDGEGWLQQGVDVLVDASDQFLADGGHFERSPMYHGIALVRYLTAVDLLRRQGRSVPPELREVAVAATEFLQRLSPPDGRIPLLNDAVFGEAPPLPAVLRYADAVGVDATATPGESMPASGYYWLGEGDDRLLVDGGQPGPAHLPGHTHNDQLSVAFWADGTRLLTDTGTPAYAPTNRREYARSVRAHNTVQYGDVEPMPVGGSYLLGRRVEPTATVTERDGVALFDGRYSREPSPRYSHRRRVYHDEDWWLVWDTVDADEEATVTSRLHVAPDIDVERGDDGRQPRFDLRDGGSTLASVVPLGAATATVATSEYCPEYGRAESRAKLSFQSEGSAVQLGFLLSTGAPRSVAVDHDGTTVAGLSVDDDYRSLPAPE